MSDSANKINVQEWRTYTYTHIYIYIYYMWVVQVKFKLCHMTQVLLALEDSQVIQVAFLIYKCAVHISHTHFNWHVILWISLLFEFYLNHSSILVSYMHGYFKCLVYGVVMCLLFRIEYVLKLWVLHRYLLHIHISML